MRRSRIRSAAGAPDERSPGTGQLRRDPPSYLKQAAWTPAAGVRLPDGGMVTSIAAFLRFAGVL